jgi:peptidoglycan/xylan/chitin deacetylase (PgdA/CDA1 family)
MRLASLLWALAVCSAQKGGKLRGRDARLESDNLAAGGITRFRPGGHYILLTFDDGPHPVLTPKLLDLLKAKKVRCTFFVQGTKAMDYPEILKRMVSEGHEVASHGWAHTSITQLSKEDLKQQLHQTSKVIEDTVKKRPAAFRPPNGNTNATLNAHVTGEQNMKVVLWNLDSLDWENKDAATISKSILTRAKPGDVILAHDTSPEMVKAAESLIDGLVKEGYELLTVSEMLSFPDDTPK